MFNKYTLLSLVTISTMFAIENLSEAKVGECYCKVVVPPIYEIKDEKIEIQKASKKLLVTPTVFQKAKKDVVIQDAYVDLKEVRATFKDVKIKLPISKENEYFSADKNGITPISVHMLAASKLNGLDVENIKVGECYKEYYKKNSSKSEKKEYVSREAFESITIQKPEFKTVNKKIEIKPSYKKIIKTPAIYETKVIKVLTQSAKQEWVKSDCDLKGNNCATVCLKEIAPKYKEITKKVLITAPITKVIEFPAVYKEVEVKELVSKATSSRKVMPELKSKYDFSINLDDIKFFWEKSDIKTDGKETGYKICKVNTKPKYKEFAKEVVKSPASVKKIEVKAKVITLDVDKLVKEGNITTVAIPPMYENVKSKVLLTPSRVIWEKVLCRADLSKKVVKDIQKALKKRGFYKYRVDGILGQGTKEALIRFQKASKLPSGGYTIKTLKALDLSF